MSSAPAAKLTIESLNKSLNYNFNLFNGKYEGATLVSHTMNNYPYTQPLIPATNFLGRHGTHVITNGSLVVHSRPDNNKRRNGQKLTRRSCDWTANIDMELNDHQLQLPFPGGTVNITSTLAIRRVLLLCECLQFKEASIFINRLNHATFRHIINGLPINLFIEKIPASISVIESLFSKVFITANDDTSISIQSLQPQSVVMHFVKMFALQGTQLKGCENVVTGINDEKFDSSHPVIVSAKNVLKVIALSEPNVKKELYARKKAIDRAIEGMGHHGLVGTSDDTLMNLHDALKIEFDRVIQCYKIAVQKLEALSLAAPRKQSLSRSVSRGPAPTKASHQRQLSLKQEEIQERLIKNKTLMNAVEPCVVTHHSLQILLGILQQRVEFDKEVLFQYTQLRKEFAHSSNGPQNVIEPSSVIAPVLMRFSYGCTQVLNMFKEVCAEMGNKVNECDEEESDISGYHSDSDSTPIPYYSCQQKTASRYNSLLYRSVRSKAKRTVIAAESGSSSGHSDNGTLLENINSTNTVSNRCVASSDANTNTVLVKGSIWRQSVRDTSEVENLRRELVKAKQTIFEMQEKEQRLKDRLAEQAQRMLERGVRFENICLGEKRPTALIRRYGNLYAQARVDTLDALDSLHPLKDAEELKSKLLFSVVVLAFRSTQQTAVEVKKQISQLLQIDDTCVNQVNREATSELNTSIKTYLRNTCDQFDTTKNVEEVCNQIWATLYDYPCLKVCDGLTVYVRDCVKLAWALNCQNPPFMIEYENRQFRRDLHVRFHTSNQDSDTVKTYLWPALLEDNVKGACVHKGVVIT